MQSGKSTSPRAYHFFFLVEIPVGASAEESVYGS